MSILLVKVKFMAESALCMMSNACEPTDDPQIAPLFRSLSQYEILKHNCKTNLNDVMFYNVRSLIYGLFFYSILIERHIIMSYLNKKRTQYTNKQTNKKTRKKTRIIIFTGENDYGRKQKCVLLFVEKDS